MTKKEKITLARERKEEWKMLEKKKGRNTEREEKSVEDDEQDSKITKGDYGRTT